jgi:ATP-dependent DNA helicase RecG
LSSLHLRKEDEKIQTSGFVGFPLPSLKETIVNAVYHRGYESTEPTKVYLYPDRLEVTSYPGPVPGLKPEDFLPGARMPKVPARNRRIGEFLKELRLAESRGTGVPTIFRTMAQNGSPQPKFEFDADRTYFTVILPAHPEYVALAALREAAELEATGFTDKALARLEAAHITFPGSGSIVATLIKLLCKRERFKQAREVYERFRSNEPRTGDGRVIATLAESYLTAELTQEAKDVLGDLASITSAREAIDLAILQRRALQEEKANRLFQKAEGSDAMLSDPKALHEFAQCKIKLSREAHKSATKRGKEVNRKLLLEASELLQRVLQMDAHPKRHAHAWLDMAKVLFFLKEPRDEINNALKKAAELAPQDAEIEEQTRWIRQELFRDRR